MRAPRYLLALVVALSTACPDADAPAREPGPPVSARVEAEPEPIAPENLRRAELAVEGMTCSGCEYNVSSGLKLVEGVDSATADAKKGRAYVEYDVTRVSVEDLVGAVTQVGYRTEFVPEAPSERSGGSGN